MVILTTTPLSPRHRGKDRNKDVGVDGIEDNLKDGVKSHQTCTIFRIPFGQVIPDNDHGNTSGQANHDEPHHVFGISPQENNRQNEHEDGTNNPVLN